MTENTNDLITPFQTPIYVGQLDQPAFDTISDAVINYIDRNPDRFVAPEGWRCPTLSNIESCEDDYGDDGVLRRELQTAMKRYYEAWQFEPTEVRIEQIWINIAKPGAFQEYHDHLRYMNDRLFSGVLYVIADEKQGNLKLKNPINPYAHCMLASPLFDDCTIEPRAGRLVCFPSWMEHCVEANKTDSDRISVAWNAVVSSPSA